MSKGKNKVQMPLVFGPKDYDDIDHDLAESINEFAEKGCAHIYMHRSYRVLSAVPLTRKQVASAILEAVEDEIKDVESAEDAWHFYPVSARDINRIARKKGFTMPKGWYLEKPETTKPCPTCGRQGGEEQASAVQ